MNINTDQISLTGFTSNLKFHYRRGKGHLLRYILNRIRWHWYPRFHILTKYPEHVDIELSAMCDMKCPMCYTITDEFKESVKRRNMKWDNIKKILDECGKGGVFSIRLSWRGESLLNKNYVETIKYAKSVGIKEVSSLTNALRLTPEIFEQLVDANMDWLTISVDGVGDTYNEIRNPAVFDELIKKLEKFKEIKRKKGKVKPVIKVQTIYTAIEKNPQIYFDTFEPLVDQVSANQLVDYLQQDNEIVYAPKFDCPVLYQRLTIGSDGRILMCYNDEFDHHVYGDITEGDTILDVWEGKEMTKARELHMKHSGIEAYHACSRCFLPREHESYEVVNINGKKISIDKLTGREQEVGK
jgi:radical SAM protein with 4Fe4S-binding SPASM domain